MQKRSITLMIMNTIIVLSASYLPKFSKPFLLYFFVRRHCVFCKKWAERVRTLHVQAV